MVPEARTARAYPRSGDAGPVLSVPGREDASDARELPVAVRIDPVAERPDAIPETIDDEASRTLLAGAVSHELRTTLALISGYSQSLLHLSLDDETRRRYVERILAAADTLTEFADQILDLSVPGTGGPALRRRPVAVEWLVDRLMRQMAGSAEPGTVHFQSPRQLPLVDVDPTWIGHVLRNLVANSLKHGAGPTAVVTIRARYEDGYVIVSVQDEGSGFESDERELVFDPFYRGRRARARGLDGAGLGLYLCRQLVEAHGGRIWVDEGQGGASVSFSLPRYRVLRAVRGHGGQPARAALVAGG
jgi:two-component system sensor histidine kinase KdpD